MSNLSLWSRRDPFSDFDELLRNTFGQLALDRAARSGMFTPAAEVRRDGDDAVIRLELPGIIAERDVAVEVEGDQLIVHGERRDEHVEEKDGSTLREVRYGTFRRSFTLPRHVTAEAVSATYDAGVLSVRVVGAYAESPGTRRIPVTATGGESAAPVAAAPATGGQTPPATEPGR